MLPFSKKLSSMKSDRKEEFELREGNKKADNKNSETAEELGSARKIPPSGK